MASYTTDSSPRVLWVDQSDSEAMKMLSGCRALRGDSWENYFCEIVVERFKAELSKKEGMALHYPIIV